jgi:RHS repeat-associated protein
MRRISALALLASLFATTLAALTAIPARAATNTGAIGERGFYKLESHRLTDRLHLHVNVANGNLVIHSVDLHVKGTGLDLSVERYYNSLGGSSSVFGYGRWVMGLPDAYLDTTFGDGSVSYHAPSGYGAALNKDINGNFITPAGLDADLAQSGHSYTLTFHANGEQYNFSDASTPGHAVLLSDVDRNGNRLAFSWSGQQLGSITDTQGRVTSFFYDSSGALSAISDPASRTYTYNNIGSGVLQQFNGPSSLNLQAYSYDSSGRVTKITTDGGNRATTFTYDSSDRVTAITYVTNFTNMTGPTTTFAYAPSGPTPSTTVWDANSHGTTYYYDSSGRVTKAVDGLGHTKSSSYTSNNNVSQSTDAMSNNSSFGYDALNNLTSVQSATGASDSFGYTDTTYKYSPTSHTDGQGNQVAYSYTSPGNVTSATNQLASQNRYQRTYNPNGTVATETDAMGHVTTYGYDGAGNLTSVTPPAPLGAITISYTNNTALSRVSSIQDGKGQRTSFAYDTLDRVTSITPQDNAVIQYTYDGSGNVTQVVDNGSPGAVVTTQYDALNRPVAKSDPAGSISATYDGVGNMITFTPNTSILAGNTTLTYVYDGANRLVNMTEPNPSPIGNALTTIFDYDNNDHRIHTFYPNGVTQRITYDNSGRETTIMGYTSSTTLTSFTYSYVDPATSRDTNLRQNVTDKDGAKTVYTYDVLNRLVDAKTTSSVGVVTTDVSYGYDGNGNRTSRTTGGFATNFGYNAGNELTSGAAPSSYDANGNQTADQGTSIVYNAKNQASTVTDSNNASRTFTYSGIGQTERLTAGSTSFINDFSSAPVSETASGLNGAVYYNRDNAGNLVSVNEQTSLGQRGVFYYLYDGLGSVVALTSVTGSVVETYTYDPDGRTSTGFTAPYNPWQFAGGYADGTTGLIKFGTRYYDPYIARWTQQDAVPGSLQDLTNVDRYTYAADDPVNAIDPSGRYPFADCLSNALAIGTDTQSVFAAGSLAVIGGLSGQAELSALGAAAFPFTYAVYIHDVREAKKKRCGGGLSDLF